MRLAPPPQKKQGWILERDSTVMKLFALRYNVILGFRLHTSV